MPNGWSAAASSALHLLWQAPPSSKNGTVSLSRSQLACLLDGIDWRNPQVSWRPASAG